MNEYPICKILGVNVGIPFRVKEFGTDLYYDYDFIINKMGQLNVIPKDKSKILVFDEKVLEIISSGINHPECVSCEKLWTENELHLLSSLKTGCYITRTKNNNSDKVYIWDGLPEYNEKDDLYLGSAPDIKWIAFLPASVFPSILPCDIININRVLNLKERLNY